MLNMKMKCLKFKEWTMFYYKMNKNYHMTYKVDDLDFYLKDGDYVIVDHINLDEKQE